MPYHYSDPTRENDPHALPDVEVFELTSIDVRMDSNPDCASSPGWYFAFGFPGCLWDGDPSGPYASEAEALAAARELGDGD